MNFVEQFSVYLNELKPSSILDIALVTAVVFGALVLARGTRAMQLLRGLLVLALLVTILSTAVNLPAFSWLITSILPVLLVALPVIFQPELRRALEQLGQPNRYLRLFRRQQYDPIVRVIASACLRLSQRRHGALIVIERDTRLQEYIDTGIFLDAKPTPELLLTIFDKHTDLHDGAVIVRGERLAAAACVMPLSTSSLRDSKLGLRHRASLGISEVSDAVVVVVSEETGQIAIAHHGRLLRKQDPARLDNILNTFLRKENQSPINDDSHRVQVSS